MDTENKPGNSENEYSYSFTSKEILFLAKFLRKRQDELPIELYNFSKYIENQVYNNMNLEEVSEFFS